MESGTGSEGGSEAMTQELKDAIGRLCGGALQGRKILANSAFTIYAENLEILSNAVLDLLKKQQQKP